MAGAYSCARYPLALTMKGECLVCYLFHHFTFEKVAARQGGYGALTMRVDNVTESITTNETYNPVAIAKGCRPSKKFSIRGRYSDPYGFKDYVPVSLICNCFRCFQLLSSLLISVANIRLIIRSEREKNTPHWPHKHTLRHFYPRHE